MPEIKNPNTIKGLSEELSKKKNAAKRRDSELDTLAHTARTKSQAQESDIATRRAYRQSVENRHWQDTIQRVRNRRSELRTVHNKDGSIGAVRVDRRKELTIQEKLEQAIRREAAAKFRKEVYNMLVEQIVAEGSGRQHDEIIEPQVAEAVQVLKAKGYKIKSAGTWGMNGEYQNIYGDFETDSPTAKKLEQLGVLVGRNHLDQSFIRYKPNTYTLKEITETWKRIAEILPNLINKGTNKKIEKENIEVSESAKRFGWVLDKFVSLFRDGDVPRLFKGFIESKPDTQEYEVAIKELNLVYQKYMQDDRVPSEKISDYKADVENVAKKLGHK